MFASLFSSLTNPRISPSAWDPSSPLPPGSTSIVETFTAPINPSSSVTLIADTGAWSHGTVVFKTSSAGSEAGPGLSRGISLGLGGSGGAHSGAGSSSTSHSRTGASSTNYSQEYDHSSGLPGGKVDPDGPPSYEAIVASVPDTNPAPAPPQDVKARQLDNGGGLLQVRVEARWNGEKLWDEAKVDLVQVNGGIEVIIQTPNMSPSRLTSQLSFHVTFTFPGEMTRLARLATRGSQWRTLGERSLAQLRIDEVDINTANTLVEFKKLRAGRVGVVTVNKEIKGDYEVDSLDAKTGNGAVEANVVAVGNCTVQTSNSSITGTLSASVLSLKTVNGKIAGTFSSSSLSAPLRLETQNGALAGTWTGLGGVVASTSNGRIDAAVKVRGRLELRTANGAVSGKVECLGEEVWRSPLMGLVGEDTRAAAEGREGGGGTLEVEVKTSNAKIDLELLPPPVDLQVLISAKTANAPVSITHHGTFDGHVLLATSNAEADLKLPQASKATLTSDGKSKKEGEVASGREGPAAARGSRIEAKSSNAVVRVLVTG